MLFDAGVIVVAVAFALGKRWATNAAVVLTLLGAGGYGLSWLSGNSAAALSTVVWGLLFAGCLYVGQAPITKS
jgi:hypothetical protein